MASTQKQLDAARIYREKNSEAVKDSNRRSYIKNSVKRRAFQAKYREENPGKVKAAALKCLYGISKNEFDERLLNQVGKCAVCCEELKKPCVDHCHQTGKVRGLLCHSCNISLGLMKDSFTNLIRAADYIRRASFV